MKRVSLVLSFLFFFCSYTIGLADVKMSPVEKWSNLFQGRDVVFHFALSSDEEIQGTADWQLSYRGQTLARGEHTVHIPPGRSEIIETHFTTPQLKEGITLQTRLSVTLYKKNDSAPVASSHKDIWIFPDNPFYLKKLWLKERNIHLFDPEKKTSDVFAGADIPFTWTNNPESLLEIKNGIIIIGEGVSLKKYKGLPDLMIQAAAAGTPVLCLSPSGGKMHFPGMGNMETPQPNSVHFNQNAIITLLDKRLDADAWSPGQNIQKTGMHLQSRKSTIFGEFRDGEGGWPWVEIRFQQKNTPLILCGFKIIENWNSGPTPRFLFARILEYITRKE